MASMYDRIQASLAQQRKDQLLCSIPALPPDCLRIQTIDLHTCGEPLRVVVDGFPELPGRTVLERRRHCRDHHDQLRTALLWEPRGHADAYGALLVPPNEEISNNDDDDEISTADFGLIFIHNEGYSTMCGHAIIAIGTLAVLLKWMADIHEGTNELLLDVPCGRIRAFVDVDRDLVSVKSVRFHCVPSFVVALDRTVQIPRPQGETIATTKVTYDLAYGGAFYAYVDLAKNPALIENGFLADDTLSPGSVQQIIDTGMLIKRAVATADHNIIRYPSTKEGIHSANADLNFLYGTIFVNDQRQQQHSGADSRNVCIFAEAEVDRSPTGSGVSGRMALARARGEMDPQSPPRTIESITGAVFRAAIVRDHKSENEAWKSLHYPAVIPQVEGTAFVTGQHSFIIDPKDPMRNGFLLR